MANFGRECRASPTVSLLPEEDIAVRGKHSHHRLETAHVVGHGGNRRAIVKHLAHIFFENPKGYSDAQNQRSSGECRSVGLILAIVLIRYREGSLSMRIPQENYLISRHRRPRSWHHPRPALRCDMPALLVILICISVCLTRPASALDPGQASAFMEALGNETIETLRETGIDRETREERLRVLLNRGVAFNEIGRMVMGRYWTKANAQQRQRYLKAFKELTIEILAAGFEKYSGETIRVISERSGGKRDRLVETEISGSEGQPLKVYWRVREIGSSLKIIDVVIEGISMLITKRSEFSAVIQRSGGKLDGLIEAIEAKVAATN